MTRTEIAIRLLEPIGKQFDEPIVAMVKDKILVTRATILKQRLNETPNQRGLFRRSKIYELESKELDSGDCVLVTKECVIKPLQTEILFDYIGSSDYGNPFGLYNALRAKYKQYGLTGNRPFATYVNNKIEIYNAKGLESIGVQFIPENPEDLCECKNCDSECDFDTPFNIINQVEDYIEARWSRFPRKREEEEIQINNTNG